MEKQHPAVMQHITGKKLTENVGLEPVCHDLSLNKIFIVFTTIFIVCPD